VTVRRHLSFAAKTRDASWPLWHTSAWLTVPTHAQGDELHVLVHGAGADHRYWDFPIEPDRYSYVDWATQRGIVTLNIDRVGCGQSSRPPGAEVTLEAQAHNLAQVIEAARGGHEGVPPCRRVVLIGHSMGSVICGATAMGCSDVDAVVLTGYLPVDGTTEMGDELFDFAFTPALDAIPQLRGLVDENYLAAREDIGVDELRYWNAQTDPKIMGFDALIKGPATKAELADAAIAGPLIRSLTTPALGLVGQHDALLIDGGLGETDTFDTVRRVANGIGPNFGFSVVLDAGHMLNLHRNAHDTYSAIERWLEREPFQEVGT
jgi:pimeloyl-ACP methyl ester carboxylesterase